MSNLLAADARQRSVCPAFNKICLKQRWHAAANKSSLFGRLKPKIWGGGWLSGQTSGCLVVCGSNTVDGVLFRLTRREGEAIFYNALKHNSL